MTERDQYVRQIDTLVTSEGLHGADSLCRLLRYLANHTLDFPGDPLNEYRIATEVLGRSSDFDPQLDSIIRVQAGRLRSKLAKYYESEGADDPIVVDLPKGGFRLTFEQRLAPLLPVAAPVERRYLQSSRLGDGPLPEARIPSIRLTSSW